MRTTLLLFGDGTYKPQVHYAQQVAKSLKERYNERPIVLKNALKEGNNLGIETIDISNDIDVKDRDIFKKAKEIEKQTGFSIKAYTIGKEVQSEGNWKARRNYINLLVKDIMKIEKIAKDYDVGKIVHGIGPHIPVVASEIVSEIISGIKTITIRSSPMQKRSILLFKDYKTVAGSVVNWPEDIKEKCVVETRKWIKNYISEQEIQKYSTRNSIFSLTSKAFKKIQEESNQLSTRNIKNFVSKIGNSIKINARKQISKYYYDSTEGNFIFMPIHTCTDSQVLLRGEPFISQVDLIKHVARNIPLGYRLVVKPHPMGVGKYPVMDMREVSLYPNVTLVSPNTNPHELIDESDLVITINSSTGFESLMHNVPVITYGYMLYTKANSCITIRNLYNTSEKINEALNTSFDKSKTLKFLAKVRKSSLYADYFGVPNTDAKNPHAISKALSKISLA